MFDFLLYYPRLFIALAFRPTPNSHVTLHHWVMAHTLFLWNKPWSQPTDTMCMETIHLAIKKPYSQIDPYYWKTRVLGVFIRCVYVLIVFSWPFLALLLSLYWGRKWYRVWKNLINNLPAVIGESRSDFSVWEQPLSALSFYVPLLYIKLKTGVRLPDDKRETDWHCKLHGIPTPRIYKPEDAPLPAAEYIVKHTASSGAKGIFFTTEPDQYLADNERIVQGIVRNPPELRRMWGTDTLASIRFFTFTNEKNTRDIAGAVFRIPIGESRFDNTNLGNGYARVDRQGRLERAFTDNDLHVGFSHHPTTNEPIEGVQLDQFAECARLALKTHDSIAPTLPTLNSDIALTEQGPLLVEVNRAPGQYWNMYRDGFSESCVDALCRGIAGAKRRDRRLRTRRAERTTPRAWESERASVEAT